MNKLISFIGNTLLDKKLDFRVRLFNVLAMAGTLIGVLMTLLSIIAKAGTLNVVTNVVGTVLAFILLIYSYCSGRYLRCYIISIVAIFLGLFPVLFFTSGGYHGGMPSFFIFAVLFTIFMLDGKLAVVVTALEIATYAALCVYAYSYPEQINCFNTEFDILIDTVISFSFVSIILGVTMFLHFRMYNMQQLELEKARQRLSEENAALDRLNQLKTEFLSNVSHELKTPLTVMSVSAQNSRRDLSELPELTEASGQMKLIAAEADRLALMVGQILDMTRIEEGRMACEMRECSVDEIIQSTISTYYPFLKKNNNRLIARTSDDLPPVHADGGRISQVLVNLLQNAIRYTQSGEITINAGQDGHFVRITVSDTGDGIEPERLPFIFERFISHDNKKAPSGKDTGTGLGLYICKHIVETHGGEIVATSTVGKGTAVSFTIPVHPQAL